jgi:hypothetical protein
MICTSFYAAHFKPNLSQVPPILVPAQGHSNHFISLYYLTEALDLALQKKRPHDIREAIQHLFMNVEFSIPHNNAALVNGCEHN